MMSLVRLFTWWLQQRRKEEQLREELAFHLEQKKRERRSDGLPEDEAMRAAQRDLGNEARLREEVRALWTWRPLDDLAQDLRLPSPVLASSRRFSRTETRGLRSMPN
jgi:hypothetical protein